MDKLTKEEKEIYKRKRELIYNRISDYRNVTPLIKLSIDKGLMKLIKNKRAEFISEMYVDYIENIIKNSPRINEKKHIPVFEYYYKFFHYDYSGDMFKELNYFAGFLINSYAKTKVGYHLFQDKTDHYEKNYVIEDNKRLLDLAEYLRKIRGPMGRGIEYLHYAVSYKNLLTYILMHDNLLLDNEKSKNLINYLRDSYNEYYDYFNMNDYNDPYEYHDYDKEAEEENKRIVFHPHVFVKKYEDRLNKKTIE